LGNFLDERKFAKESFEIINNGFVTFLGRWCVVDATVGFKLFEELA